MGTFFEVCSIVEESEVSGKANDLSSVVKVLNNTSFYGCLRETLYKGTEYELPLSFYSQCPFSCFKMFIAFWRKSVHSTVS